MADLQYHQVDKLHSVHVLATQLGGTGTDRSEWPSTISNQHGILSYLAKREPRAAGLQCALTAATKSLWSSSPGVGLRQGRVSQVPKSGQRERRWMRGWNGTMTWSWPSRGQGRAVREVGRLIPDTSHVSSLHRCMCIAEGINHSPVKEILNKQQQKQQQQQQRAVKCAL